MAQASIHTELDNRCFVPGETLRGRVTWRADAAIEAAELRLFYYTVGKGTRDVGVVDNRKWTSPQLTAEEPFEFELPDGPYTFSGQLISLIWALELVLEPGMVTELFEITLSPTAEGIDLYRYPIAPDADDENAAAKWLRARGDKRTGTTR